MRDTRNELIIILKKYTFSQEVWKNFTENTNIIKDLKINSARLVDIVLDLEELYNIEIPDEELEKLTCFKDILSLIENKISSAEKNSLNN